MMTLNDFKAARKTLDGVLHPTDLIYSPFFSRITGNQVYIKPENMQVTGAYKIRGAYFKCSTLSDEEKARGLVTASAGNHAQGVAYAAQKAGVSATIVMPTTTPLVKVNNTKDYGAKVVLHGEVFDDAAELAAQLSQEQGLTYVHPFNDLTLATGQGTIAYEIFQDLPDVDVILVPVGGGGLAALGPLVQLLHQGGVEGPGVHPGSAEDADGHVIPLPQQARQQVLRAHIGAAAPDGVLHGDFHHPAGPWGQALGGVPSGEARPHAALNDLDNHVVGESGLQKHIVGSALVLPDEAQKQMFRAHIAVAQLAGGLLAEAEGLLRAGTEFFLIHVYDTSFREVRGISSAPGCGSGPGAPPPARTAPRGRPFAVPPAGR